MRGTDEASGTLFSYVNLEARIPARHLLRKIRQVVNEAQQTDAAAEFEERSADPADRRSIVATEIGDGLVIWCQPPGQPFGRRSG